MECSNKLIHIKGKGEERRGERELGAESLERQLDLQAIKFQLSHVSEVKVLWGAILFFFSLFFLFFFFFLFFSQPFHGNPRNASDPTCIPHVAYTIFSPDWLYFQYSHRERGAVGIKLYQNSNG